MSVKEWFQSQAANFYDTGIQKLGRPFTANTGTKVAVLSKADFYHTGIQKLGRSFTANAGTKVAVLSKGRFLPHRDTKVRQDFHCKCRNQGCSSVQRQISTAQGYKS